MELGFTNTALIEEFNHHLELFETQTNPAANHIRQYRDSAEHLRRAMEILMHAQPIDTFPMLRILTARMGAKITTIYSDTTLSLCHASTVDESTRDAIMAIMFPLRELMTGGKFIETPGWVERVKDNSAIREFFYTGGVIGSAPEEPSADSEPMAGSREEKFVTGILAPASQEEPVDPVSTTTFKEVKLITTSEVEVLLELGMVDYSLALEAREEQIIGFILADLLGDPLSYDALININPGIGMFALDSSVVVDAIAVTQLKSIGALTEYIEGSVTRVAMPAPFFTCQLKVHSPNGGETWHVSECSIFPPSVA